MPNRPRRASALALITLIALVVLLRAPSLMQPIWNVDEAASAVIGVTMLEGGVPYRDAVDHRGPISYAVFALVFLIAGANNVLALRVVHMAALLVVCLAMSRISRLALDDRGTGTALVLFAVLSSLGWPLWDTYAFHTEFVVIVFTSLAVWWCLSRVLLRPAGLAAVACGALFGLAAFAKQPAALDFLGAAAVVAAAPVIAHGRAGMRALGSSLASAVLMGVGLSAVAVAIAGAFVWRGAWSDFLFYFLTYNTDYYVPAVPFTQRIAELPVHLRNLAGPFVVAVPIALIAAMMRSSVRVTRQRAAAPTGWWLVVVWALTSLAACTLSGRTFGHYYVQALPAACLLVGWMSTRIAVTAPHTAAPRPGEALLAVPRPLALVLSLVGLAVFLARSPAVGMLAERAFERPPLGLVSAQVPDHGRLRPILLDVTGRGMWDDWEVISEYVRDRTQSSDAIFVWGFLAQVYTLADRDPATRFSFCNFITGMIPGGEGGRPVPGAMDTLITDLESRPPAYIVDAATADNKGYGRYPISDFPRLQRFIDEGYVLEIVIDGYTIYRRRGFPAAPAASGPHVSSKVPAP